ncbi:MAG: F0F1 ATP synthase subunit gamma [Cytophagales bacterium]
MAKNKQILRRIHVVEYTKKITQAMKMVSVAKLGRLKRAKSALRPYSDGLQALFLRTLQTAGPQVLGAFTQKRAVKHVLCLVVTASRGLCGTYNNRVFQSLARYHAACLSARCKVTFLPIGQKGLQHLKIKNLPYHEEYVGLFETLDFERVQHLGDYLLGSFLQNRYQNIVMLSQTSLQGAPVEPQSLLPYALPKVSKEEDMTLYEPKAPPLLQKLIREIAALRLYQNLLAAWETEHKSRIMVMGQSTDNAEELLKKLQTTYNRIRKASVTRDLIETSAGMASSPAS